MKISYQVDCDDFHGETCEGHNIKYNLKCIKFERETECSEIEFDEGCKMTAQKTCEKTDANGSYQCYFSQTSKLTKCERINVDNNCEIINEKKCSPRANAEIGEKQICKLSSDGTECSLKTKECSDYITSTCDQFDDDKCVMIKMTITSYNDELGYPYTSDKDQCKLVTVNQKCKIDEAGNCGDNPSGGPEVYEKCAFNLFIYWM